MYVKMYSGDMSYAAIILNRVTLIGNCGVLCGAFIYRATIILFYFIVELLECVLAPVADR